MLRVPPRVGHPGADAAGATRAPDLQDRRRGATLPGLRRIIGAGLSAGGPPPRALLGRPGGLGGRGRAGTDAVAALVEARIPAPDPV